MNRNASVEVGGSISMSSWAWLVRRRDDLALSEAYIAPLHHCIHPSMVECTDSFDAGVETRAVENQSHSFSCVDTHRHSLLAGCERAAPKVRRSALHLIEQNEPARDGFGRVVEEVRQRNGKAAEHAGSYSDGHSDLPKIATAH